MSGLWESEPQSLAAEVTLAATGLYGPPGSGPGSPSTVLGCCPAETINSSPKAESSLLRGRGRGPSQWGDRLGRPQESILARPGILVVRV